MREYADTEKLRKLHELTHWSGDNFVLIRYSFFELINRLPEEADGRPLTIVIRDGLWDIVYSEAESSRLNVYQTLGHSQLCNALVEILTILVKEGKLHGRD